MDLDGDLDVVYNGSSMVYIWDPNQMKVLLMRVPPTFNYITRGIPTIANIYNDILNSGKAKDFPEAIITNSATSSTGTLTAYNLNFTSGNKYVWSIGTNDMSGCTALTAFDFDGNGISELVYRDEQMLRIMRNCSTWR
jgi:hypothetical protein